ncbi:uncharacterized protein LOC114300520 [Camellia sinensis]|uniref:uncharacterized protein LOC114300520 n=1 Tax=Camellia sinensis TaxID=4442 RepID=UPI0010361222|nr:uncharacterized protein LOC114300520 [Camellia sinensis]
MYSGCTFHICPNRDWFSNFEKLDSGTILMGNNTACKTIGIGSIQLKLDDGTVRALKEVRYVPELKKNLISLSTLASKGFKITLEGGALEVVSRTQVIMKGSKKKNLYFLQGSTVISEVATNNRKNEEIDKVDTDCTKTKVKFETAKHCMEEKMDYVHINAWRPSRVASKEGKQFWAEALTYSGHIINCLSTAENEGFGVWFGIHANDYDQLHVFGSSAYYHVQRSKLDPKAKKRVFLGFSCEAKRYRLWCPESKKVIVSRDVTFNESKMVKQLKPEDSSEQNKAIGTQQVEFNAPVVS